MDLEIVKIVDHGTLKSERVVLLALVDTNLYNYAICDNTYISGTEELSNGRRNFYWFKSIEVKAGEYVRLWTKSGSYSKGVPSGGRIIYHEIFWGMGNGVWNNTGDLAVLIEISEIETHVVKPIAKK